MAPLEFMSKPSFRGERRRPTEGCRKVDLPCLTGRQTCEALGEGGKQNASAAFRIRLACVWGPQSLSLPMPSGQALCWVCLPSVRVL